MKRRNKTHPSQPTDYTMEHLQTLPLLYPDLAGIDVGSREHYVAVPPNRSDRPVQRFGCTTPDLQAMALWLKQSGVTHVVMESTGVYWIPIAMVLEDSGLRVSLVDAREAHRLSARKTDVQDCQWIRQLFACGLLREAFRPAPQIRAARSYWRQRSEIVSMCATAVHHMQKALEQMNLQLHKTVTDIVGTTGMCIMRAIVEGNTDAAYLASMAHPNCKSPREDFIKALTGHYATEHLFALRQALERFDLYHKQMADLDQQLQCHLATLSTAPTQIEEPAQGSTATTTKKRRGDKRRKNQPHFDLASELQRISGVDLTAIEGIDALTAFTVITEQGIDMSQFPSEKHFASHLGLAPNNEITGGRVRKRKTRKVHSRAAHVLRLAAQSLANSKTALGSFYRRIRARRGAAKAIVATANKLAKLIYRMLKHGEQYVAQGMEQYEQRFQERQIQNLKRQAKALGCQVLIAETGELLS